MLVTFKNVLVLSVRPFRSKRGTECCALQFLSEDSDVFECTFFGDAVESVSALQPKSTINAISFELQPARGGGVRLEPAW